MATVYILLFAPPSNSFLSSTTHPTPTLSVCRISLTVLLTLFTLSFFLSLPQPRVTWLLSRPAFRVSDLVFLTQHQFIMAPVLNTPDENAIIRKESSMDELTKLFKKCAPKDRQDVEQNHEATSVFAKFPGGMCLPVNHLQNARNLCTETLLTFDLYALHSRNL
jgi:hypothetical protein